jgi:RNA polymerase sigma factor (sigma-70 family)
LIEIDALIADVLDPNAELADRHRAFGEIVTRFQDMAFACAYAILEDYYLAEDVAQEAFIVAWQKLDQLKEPKAFPGWFKKIVFSQCHRLTRGKRLLVTPLETGLSVPSNIPDPQALAEKIEVSERVLAAIRALPDSERMVTTLFYIDGYSQNDISDFLELQVTTVAKRLFSARRRLKQELVGMLKENLKQHRPSRHRAFADQVQARLRPFAEPDWETVTSIAYGIEADFRGDNDSWLRNRRQFDESRYIRRHYVGQHVETGQILGYGSIEQTIFLPKYQLFLVVAPEYLRSGVGDLLLDQLMKDLREVNAIAVWHRNFARLTDTLDFLKDRGFVETKVVGDLRLPVAQFDSAPFELIAEQVAARGVSITTLAEEREGDSENLRKLHELLNPLMADEPGRQPFAPVPVDTVARWFSQRNFLPDACFIARDGNRYIGITNLSLTDKVAGGITYGFTGVLREHRKQGIATALKLRAIEYARQHGYQFMRAFNHHLNLPMLALNEKLGFRRHFSYVTLEKCLKEVQAIDTGVYDAYVGRYAFDSEHLEKHQLPANLAITIKKVGTRLISEIRDMQDELFPESESRFFIKMHYAQVEFIRNQQGQVTGLIYCESGKEMRADRVG